MYMSIYHFVTCVQSEWKGNQPAYVFTYFQKLIQVSRF